MSDDGGVGIALDVCPPFPAGCVGMASAHVLGLESLELLLITKLVCLRQSVRVTVYSWKGKLPSCQELCGGGSQYRPLPLVESSECRSHEHDD